MAELTAELTLELAKARKSLKEFGSMTDRAAKRASDTGKRMGPGLFGGLSKAARGAMSAAMGAVSQIGIGAMHQIGFMITNQLVKSIGGLKGAMDLGGRLSDVAARIGDTAGAAQVLETMFAQTGVSAEKMAPTIQKMQRSIIEAGEGLTTYQRAFEGLGLDYEKLADMGGVEAFTEIAKAISGIENASEKSARAMQIFGRSGGELLPLFSDPDAFMKATSHVGKQADILTRHANTFDRIADIWAGLPGKMQGIFVGMGEDLSRHMLPFFEYLNSLDLTPIGQKLGASLAKAIDFARTGLELLGKGDLMELAGVALKMGFKEAINFLAAGIQGAMAGAITTLMKGLTAIGKVDFWKGLFYSVRALGDTIVATVLSVTGDLLNVIASIGGKLNPIADQARAASEAVREQAANFRQQGAESTQKSFAAFASREMIEGMKGALEAGKNAFSQAVENAYRPFDTSDDRKQLAAAIEKVSEATRRATDPAGLVEGKKPSLKDVTPAAAEDALAASVAAPLGSFFREVNALYGRSPQESIAAEAKRHTGLLETIAKNTTPQKAPRKPLAQQNPVAVFG